MNNLTNYIQQMGEITTTVHNLLHIEIILFKQIALDPKGNEQRNGCIEKQVEDYVYATYSHCSNYLRGSSSSVGKKVYWISEVCMCWSTIPYSNQFPMNFSKSAKVCILPRKLYGYVLQLYIISGAESVPRKVASIL